MIYRNGYRPGGSTKTNAPKSTHESDDSTLNVKNSLADGDHPTRHELANGAGHKEQHPLARTDGYPRAEIVVSILTEGLLHNRERICQISSVSHDVPFVPQFRDNWRASTYGC